MITMDDVIQKNKHSGHHFFDKDTMKFFSSTIETDLIADRFFITSEEGPLPDMPRKYTIREAIDGGRNIKTRGDFHAYDTKKDALQALDNILNGVS